VSLNSHFEHWQLFPATNSAGSVSANEIVTSSTHFSGTLVFSLGCHSGLNVPDGEADPMQTALALDWAQAFTQRGATYIGNTGYGYGDTYQLAYSERLALYFAQALQGGPSPIGVGEALQRAKLNYYNALSKFESLDEKVLGEWTLYGLPMARVHLPTPRTPTVTPRASIQPTIVARTVYANGVTAVTQSITPTLTLSQTAQGSFYMVNGEVEVVGNRPIEPRLSVNVAQGGLYAHGALIVGGRTRDEALDPYISRVITEQTYSTVEPLFNNPSFYPDSIATLNRLLKIDGSVLENLVLVPGQFRATGAASPTVGTQRVWERVDVQLYYAPITNTDFTPPIIARVGALMTTNVVSFSVQVSDETGVQRVVVLYRMVGAAEWRMTDLSLQQGQWQTVVFGLARPIEYLAQAVDTAGNVAQQTNYGNPFTVNAIGAIYLPLVVR
jgi:hypothetical protein